jgi:2-(1,2-epoxy-1,2-dihydrophenyl)acetyl-CoA isomerase
MSFETVKYEINGAVATITLNRPEALNALSLQLTLDLKAAIEQAIADKARAVILTGAGRAFCSGGDLREMREMWKKEGRIEAFLEEPLKALHEVILLIRETPIPFVAAVQGVSAGAGTNFALACDLVFAAEGTTFNEAFVRIGLSPDCGGSFFLPRAVGEKLAAELFMTGESVSAERAAARSGADRRYRPYKTDAQRFVLKRSAPASRSRTSTADRIRQRRRFQRRRRSLFRKTAPAIYRLLKVTGLRFSKFKVSEV